MTGVAQVVFPGRADGSLVKRDGKVVGSKLIGQDFSRDLQLLPEPPVGDEVQRERDFFNNQGPNQKELADQLRKNLRAYLRRERRSPTARQVPPDAVTTSASGVDPRHLRRQRAHPGAPRRPAARALAAPACCS